MIDAAQQTPQKPQYPVSSHPELRHSREIRAPIEIIPEQVDIAPEIEEHIEAVQKGEVQLPGLIEVGTHDGQPVVIQSATPQQPRIVLPSTEREFMEGAKQPASSSWLWLHWFIKRIVRMMPGRTVFQEKA